MRRLSRIPLFLAALALPACHDRGDSGDNGSLVARAADQKLTVEDAAKLMAPQQALPPNKEVVRALADLWIDYTLLATAAAQDSTLSIVDVSAIVNELVDDRLVRALRDSVVHLAVAVPADLQARYAREAPASLVHARHILLTWPNAATPAQKDSVRRAMADLRKRLTERGEDFAAVAKTASQDRGTAARGGDLGLVSRGQLAPTLDDAAFSLHAGEISQPIESQYGLHLLKVDARATPSLAQFKLAVVNQNAAAAESVFVKGLDTRAAPALMNDAPSIVRTLARDPRASLGRSADRPLLKYRMGEITEAEALAYLRNQSPALRNQIATSSNDSVATSMLFALAHRELLVAEAKRRGLSVRQDVQDQLAAAAAHNLADAARQMKLMPIPGKNSAEIIPGSVSNLLTGMLSGERREVTPLGAMSYALRAQFPSSVFDKGLDATVARVAQARRTAQAGSTEMK